MSPLAQVLTVLSVVLCSFSQGQAQEYYPDDRGRQYDDRRDYRRPAPPPRDYRDDRRAPPRDYRDDRRYSPRDRYAPPPRDRYAPPSRYDDRREPRDRGYAPPHPSRDRDYAERRADSPMMDRGSSRDEKKRYFNAASEKMVKALRTMQDFQHSYFKVMLLIREFVQNNPEAKKKAKQNSNFRPFMQSAFSDLIYGTANLRALTRIFVEMNPAAAPDFEDLGLPKLDEAFYKDLNKKSPRDQLRALTEHVTKLARENRPLLDEINKALSENPQVKKNAERKEKVNNLSRILIFKIDWFIRHMGRIYGIVGDLLPDKAQQKEKSSQK